MTVWHRIYSGYGHALQTSCREIARRAPAWVEPVQDWREAELTIDWIVDSPLGSMANRPRARDAAHWDWHYNLYHRIVGPQKRALFVVCCFERSELLRFACTTASAVFSFLPDFPTRLGAPLTNWHLQPLGVDPTIFTPGPVWSARRHDVYTFGYVAETEFIDAIERACRKAGRLMLHSGKDFRWTAANYIFAPPAKSPHEVAKRYQICRYANAMRLPYGFELAALESVLCGARPICLDLNCYRHWFAEIPSYVSVDDDTPLAAANRIAEILDTDRPPTEAEQSWIRETYNWDAVSHLFWQRLEESL